MRSIFIALLATLGLAAQQPNTVTASVSITKSINAGTSVFQIQFVDTSLSSTVDSAVAALTSVGPAASNLASVAVELNQGYVLTTYNFTMSVPAGQYTALRDKLIALQRSLSTSQTQAIGWSSSMIPGDDDVQSALEQTVPDLLTKAKQRAGTLAQAMNATLGSLVTLSTPAVSGAAGPNVTFTLSATYAVTPQP